MSAILPDEPAELTTGGDRHSVSYMLRGSEKAVRHSIDQIRRTYPVAGYGTRFTEPQEVAPGEYQARGSRQRSCD